MISLSYFFFGRGGGWGSGQRRRGVVASSPLLDNYLILLVACMLDVSCKSSKLPGLPYYVSLITFSLPKRNHLIFRQLFIDARSSKLTPEGTKELVFPFLTRLNKRRDVFADEDGDIEKDSCTGELFVLFLMGREGEVRVEAWREEEYCQFHHYSRHGTAGSTRI